MTAAEIEALVLKTHGIVGKARLMDRGRDQTAGIDADGASYGVRIADPDIDSARIALQSAVVHQSRLAKLWLSHRGA